MSYNRSEFSVDGVVYLDVSIQNGSKVRYNRAQLGKSEVDKELVYKQLEHDLECYVASNPNWAA